MDVYAKVYSQALQAIIQTDENNFLNIINDFIKHDQPGARE